MAHKAKSFSLKTLFSFLGPGFLITVGFIDPGNWATNIGGVPGSATNFSGW